MTETDQLLAELLLERQRETTRGLEHFLDLDYAYSTEERNHLHLKQILKNQRTIMYALRRLLGDGD